MTWKAIVVGVDSSPEAAWAASFGAELAKTAGTSCHLVHAVRDVLTAFALAELPEQAQELSESHLTHAKDDVQHGLWGVVAPEIAEHLVIRPGRPTVVLKEIATTLDAGLIVLGGKHHTALERWFAGSTALNVARTTDVPLLVTGGNRGPIRRILAAVDQSYAAQPTIKTAERLATLLGAELRIVCAYEPLPILPDAPGYDVDSYYRMLDEHVQREVWPLVLHPKAEKVTRHGLALDVITREVAEWPADLVVVGSHGKGFVDRLLIGSVTERLLNQLPTSLLVVPAHVPVNVKAAEQSGARKTEPVFA
ncbi:MAG TPA: universal stress protein [Gemmatimonadales bacterium]|nr:universal stress protein [Gemmatimonadales bacterium]